MESSSPFLHSTQNASLDSVEVQKMRRAVDDIPKRVWAVAMIGFWERFTFWGVTAPWQNYIEHPAQNKTTPGALGLGQAMATRLNCAFFTFYYVSPLLFGIVSDTRLGRFKTLCCSTIFYVFGIIVLVASSSPAAHLRGFGFPGLAAAMVFIALGGGGFRATIIPFLADQYTESKSQLGYMKTGEVVKADRALTLQYIYNTYYWLGNLGSLSVIVTTLIETHLSFWWAYMVCLVSMLFAVLTLLFGARSYVKPTAEGNVLPTAIRILACATKNGFNMSRAEPSHQLLHHGVKVTWDKTFVHELSRALRACRVLIAFIMFFICFDQLQNNLVSQAARMKAGVIPNDMMPVLNSVACIVFGPIIQLGLYPCLQRRKIEFQPIARITVGFSFMSLAMMYAAVVQHLIYSSGPCYHLHQSCTENQERQAIKINVWAQVPMYIFMALGEIFAYVTALEYAYDHSPKEMKVIIQAISLLIAGLGSACAMALTPVARDPYMRTLYLCLMGGMTVTTAFFWILFRKYDEASTEEEQNGHHAELKGNTEEARPLNA